MRPDSRKVGHCLTEPSAAPYMPRVRAREAFYSLRPANALAG